MTKEKFLFNIDPETRRKLEHLAESNHFSMSEMVRGLILKAYEDSTDTVRLPVVGRIANGRVFIDDSGKEYVGSDTGRE